LSWSRSRREAPAADHRAADVSDPREPYPLQPRDDVRNRRAIEQRFLGWLPVQADDGWCHDDLHGPGGGAIDIY